MKRPIAALRSYVRAALAQLGREAACAVHVHANNATGSLSANIGSGDTTINLTTGHGARFPATSTENYFHATLIDASNNIEIIRVTTRATDTLTVLRGQDGTTARAYSAGDKVELRPSNILLQLLQQETIQALDLFNQDSYTGTLSPAPKGYNTNQVYLVRIPAVNTVDNPTINLNGFGAKTIKKFDGNPIVRGDLAVNSVHMLCYNGTDMILMTPGCTINSGGYNPTLTNVANIDSSTGYIARWMRVGDTIHVAGKVDIDVTSASTLTELRLSLPVGVNFTLDSQLAGTAVRASGASLAAAILSDATNDRALLRFTSDSVTTSAAFYYHFSYSVP